MDKTKPIVELAEYGLRTYSVTSNGKVYSHRSHTWLKGTLDKDGYRTFMLFKKTYKGHRLVASAWLTNPHNYSEVNHKNGIKDDNRAENLEWCSRSQNIKHAFDNGYKTQKGEANSNAKLTKDQVTMIRNCRIDGKSVREIAEAFNVTTVTIYNICRFKNWSIDRGF